MIKLVNGIPEKFTEMDEKVKFLQQVDQVGPVILINKFNVDPEVVKIWSDFVYNRTQDATKFLSLFFPESWIRSHPNNLSPPPSKEIVPIDTAIQQFEIVEDWFATNWSGVCNQLSEVTIPTLVVTGTEDVSVPAANSLIIAQKIPGAWLVQIKEAGHGLMYQYPEKLSSVIQTFLNTTTTTTPSSNATSTAIYQDSKS